MRNLVLWATAAVAAVALPGAASATSCVTSNCVFTPGDPEFQTSGDTTPPITGGVTATIGRSSIPAGIFTDTYVFIVDVDGLGSGTFSTSLSGDGTTSDPTNIDFISATINGTPIPIFGIGTPLEFGGITGVMITAGAINQLVISGRAYGTLGSYGGNLTFTPAVAVPEPATWGLMLAGFGTVGFGMRRRRKTQVQFS